MMVPPGGLEDVRVHGQLGIAVFFDQEVKGVFDYFEGMQEQRSAHSLA